MIFRRRIKKIIKKDERHQSVYCFSLQQRKKCILEHEEIIADITYGAFKFCLQGPGNIEKG